MKSEQIEQSYARVADLLTADSVPSETLDIDVTLDLSTRLLYRQKLVDQLEVLKKQNPVDDSNIAMVEKRIHQIDLVEKRIQEMAEEIARKVANGDIKEINIRIQRKQFGIYCISNLHASSLGMAVNFLGILYLYRFKSACHNGRFAKAFEPLLITDEMRELAKRFNIPLKLKATYDQQQFDAIDHFFCQRYGIPNVSGQFAESGAKLYMPRDSDLNHGRSGDIQNFAMVERESLGRASDVDTIMRDSEVEHESKEPHFTGPRLEEAVLAAGDKSGVTDTQLLVFKAIKAYRLLPSAEMYLPTIFNVDNYTALRGDQWDFIQFMVKMTEKIQHILSTRQEILSVLGVREFFVTDIDCETHDLYGLADQFLKHGKAPLCIKSSAKPYSLRARSLIPYKVSHTLVHVDQKGQRSLELDLTDRNEAFKLALTQREEEITKLMRNLSTVENRVRQLESENTAQNQAVQEKKNLELQLEHAKQEVEIVQGLLKTEKEEFKKAETACTKAALDSRQIQDKLTIAMQEKSNLEQRLENLEKEAIKVQDLNKKQQSELARADEKITSQLVRIKELESKGKQSEIPRVDKSTCTPSLPEETLEQISEAISTEETSSSVEPKPIGGTKYIGTMKPVEGKHGGSEWTLQVLGSRQSGTEPGQFNSPNGLAWHGDQLVICDTENHRIQILNKNKVVIEIIRFDGQFDKKFKPLDVAISPDGHFFITDIGNNQIIICDQNKKIIQIIPQSADIEVRSITVMAAFIFVTDSKGKSLIKYNIKDGKLVARVSDQFSDPHSVMATSNNHLLVSDRDKHVIHVLDSDLNFLNSYRNDRLEYPRGLDVDSHGNIYICTRQSNGIVKLRSDGQLDCVLFEGVVYYPEFIAVNDDITTTIALTAWYQSVHQIRVYSVST
ncbi:uncharacterized protein [Ptychodera flava]|uniref:uncharacterized protein n=1 Tax=Ptychodera flava TaxID=63121 RepID=UPI003969E468